MADQTPAETVDCDLTQTFFWQDFGGFDYVGAFDAESTETKKGKQDFRI